MSLAVLSCSWYLACDWSVCPDQNHLRLTTGAYTGVYPIFALELGGGIGELCIAFCVRLSTAAAAVWRSPLWRNGHAVFFFQNVCP